VRGTESPVIALGKGESTGRIVRLAEVDGVIVSTTRYSEAECVHGMHYHENPHLCLLIQGADIEVRGGRSYTRRCGDLHFYHAGESHASHSRTRRPTSALVEFQSAFLARHELTEQQLADAARENTNAPFLLLKMQQELRANDSHSSLSLHALVLELVNYSRRRHERKPPSWVTQVAELLDTRRNARLTLPELGNAVGTHPVTISKNFREYFSCTLGEYRRRLMVRQSIPMIRESAMSLTDVAFTCGFADQSHFTRTFQQVTGFRPSAFRKL